MGLIVTLQYIVEVLTRGSKKAAIPKSEIDMFADSFSSILMDFQSVPLHKNCQNDVKLL